MSDEYPADGFRAISPDLASIEVRDTDGEAPVISVRFAVFNEWAEIDSFSEGHFMERFAPGSLDESLRAETPKVLFQHGKDPDLGAKVIAAPVTARTEAGHAILEGPLLNGVPPLIVEGLRAGAYGASMQFHAEAQEVDRSPGKSDYNPLGLPERTVTRAMVREGGPVTWGAYAGAAASVRSLTDEMAPPTINYMGRGNTSPSTVTITGNTTSTPLVVTAPLDFDAELDRLVREHPEELRARLEAALKKNPVAEQPAAPTVQPRFRDRKEYLQWLTKS